MCEDKTWYDTGLRSPENICCDPEKGKKDPTWKACVDLDAEYKLCFHFKRL